MIIKPSILQYIHDATTLDNSQKYLAIGAQFADLNKNVVVIAGDGGFQMNIQELMTIFQYKLKIKILVIDNSSLGMVRQWQQLFLC